MSVYRRYRRADDDLCQSNGHFSLNLREGALDALDALLRISDGDVVAWVGCGDGREMLSLAKRHPGARFHGYDVNACAVAIAERVAASEGLRNVALRACDFRAVPGTAAAFSRVYSAACTGCAALYGRIVGACRPGGRVCMLREMWAACAEELREMDERAEAEVRLAYSGERRRLCCARV